MKKQILFITLTLYTFSVFAQKKLDLKWTTPGGGNVVTVSPDGSIYSVGTLTDSFKINGQTYISNGKDDMLVYKHDNNGNLLWVKQLGGVAQEEIVDIKADKYGSIYITGEHDVLTVFSNDTLFTKSHENIFLAKLDGSGNVLWAKNITGISVLHMFNSLALDGNDNPHICASIGHFKNDTLTIGNKNYIGSGTEDIYIIKYDTNGDVVWSVREHGTYINRPYGLSIDASGNIYNTGHFSDTAYFGGTQYTTTKQAKIYLSKYDANGNLIFVKTPAMGGNGTGLDITVSKSGSIYICGNLSGGDTTVFGKDSLISINQEAFIAKYNASGDALWAKQHDVLYALHILADDHEDIYLHLDDSFISLVKYDSAGNIQGSNKDSKPVLPISDIALANTGFYATGLDNNNIISEPLVQGNRVYVTKVGPFPAGISQHQNNSDTDITLYPNPNNGQFTISGDGLKSFTGYAVYNSIGQQVHKDVLSKQNSASIDLPELPTGFYTVQLSSKQKVYSLTFIIP